MFSIGRARKFACALVLVACGASTPSTAERTIVRQVVDEHATVTVTRIAEPPMAPAALVPAADSNESCLPDGVHVSSIPINDGVRIDFTARADLVPRVRRLVTQVANEHNSALMKESAGAPRTTLFGVRGTAGASETPGGASLLLKPSDPDELEGFRDYVMQAVDGLSRGELDPCPLPPLAASP